MIPSAKNRLFGAWFCRHIERRLLDRFGTMRIHGLASFVTHTQDHPAIVVANHTGWWDPLVAAVLCNRLTSVDGYAVMDAANLRRHPYFSRLGAIGVELGPSDEARRDGARLIRHCVGLLDRPGRVLWIYPQGREQPALSSPLAFQGGAAIIARLARTEVIPVATRYVFGGRELPDVYVSIGPCLREGPAQSAHHQREAVQRELERIELTLAGKQHAFDVILPRSARARRDWASGLLARLFPLPESSTRDPISEITRRPLALPSTGVSAGRRRATDHLETTRAPARDRVRRPNAHPRE